MVQKGAFCCGTDPSILDNRSVRGGSRDHLKKHLKFNMYSRPVAQVRGRGHHGDCGVGRSHQGEQAHTPPPLQASRPR